MISIISHYNFIRGGLSRHYEGICQIWVIRAGVSTWREAPTRGACPTRTTPPLLSKVDVSPIIGFHTSNWGFLPALQLGIECIDTGCLVGYDPANVIDDFLLGVLVEF